MDFKSLLGKLDSMEAPPSTPKAPELPKAIQLNEDQALRVLAGTSTLKEAAELMEKAESKAQQKAAGAALAAKKSGDTSKLKGASKEMAKMSTKELEKVAGTKHKGLPEKKKKTDESVEVVEAEKKETTWTDKSGKKHPATQIKGDKYTGKEAEKDDKKSKKDESIDKEAFKSKFSKLVKEAKKGSKPDFLDVDGDGDKKEPMKKAVADKKKTAPKKGVNPFAKKKTVKESVFEAEEEGVEDLLAAVEEEINNPGGSVDNLRDVMNATIDADQSPEFEKARAVINKYLDLVDTAEMGSEEDGIEPMSGGDIASHIQEYDLTDRLQHAAAMLEKIVGVGEGLGRELGNTPRDNLIKRFSPTVMDNETLMKAVKKTVNNPEFTEDLVLKIVDAGDTLRHPVGKFIQKEFEELQYDMGRKYEDEPEQVAYQLITNLRNMTKDVTESAEKRAPAKKKEREVTLPSGAKTKATTVQGWQSQKADKEAKKDVKESVEQKLTFEQMAKLVIESGGQQQIDPLDKELFAWATRVAHNKLGEGTKAELYAGLVYERMGGRFEMYDVLSEDRK